MFAANSVSAVGLSNTRDAIEGYHSGSPGDKIVHQSYFQNYAGGTLEFWADPTKNNYALRRSDFARSIAENNVSLGSTSAV